MPEDDPSGNVVPGFWRGWQESSEFMNRMARGGNWSAGIFRNMFSSYKEAKKDRCVCVGGVNVCLRLLKNIVMQQGRAVDGRTIGESSHQEKGGRKERKERRRRMGETGATEMERDPGYKA